MVAEEIFVIEWRLSLKDPDWEPTLEVAYTKGELRTKMDQLRRTHGNRRGILRIRPYGRIRG